MNYESKNILQRWEVEKFKIRASMAEKYAVNKPFTPEAAYPVEWHWRGTVLFLYNNSGEELGYYDFTQALVDLAYFVGVIDISKKVEFIGTRKKEK